MFDLGNAASVARELNGRYDPLRAVTLTARLLQKAMFAGRSDEVVFWALVYAFYRGNGLSAFTREQLDSFRAELLTSVDRPTTTSVPDAMPALKRRLARR